MGHRIDRGATGRQQETQETIAIQGAHLKQKAQRVNDDRPRYRRVIEMFPLNARSASMALASPNAPRIARPELNAA